MTLDRYSLIMQDTFPIILGNILPRLPQVLERSSNMSHSDMFLHVQYISLYKPSTL